MSIPDPREAEMAEDPAERLLLVQEVAHQLRVSKMTIYRLVARGDLPSMRIGRSLRIPPDAVRNYLKAAAS